MPKYDYDLIVIGGGAAGLTSSTSAGSLGAKTLLIEKEKELGGDCLHFGCVPSKSLIKSAYAYNVLKHSERYGLPKIEPPPVDFKNVRDRIQGIISTIQAHDDPQVIYDKYNVETKFGEPKFLDNHTISLEGKSFTSRNFIIATGSSPFIPPIEGINDVPYITNVDVFTINTLPDSLIVLGGGPIGCEMAQSFARLGSKVTVVEFAPRVLIKEDEDISEFMQKKLEEDDIEFFLGYGATKAVKENGQIAVTIEHKEKGQQVIMTDQLLVATGRKANVDGMDLEKAGVNFSPKGINVDKRLRTSSKNIFACGDVNGGFQFTHVAGYEAGIAMANAVMRLPATVDYTKVPWVTYLDPEVASVGYNETRAKEADLDFIVVKESLERNDRALAESETDGFIKILVNKKDMPIGVQIVSFHGGDLIHEWVAAMNGKVGLSTIANAIHAYPTLSEISKGASGNYIFQKFLEGPGGKIFKLLFKHVYKLQGKI